MIYIEQLNTVTGRDGLEQVYLVLKDDQDVNLEFHIEHNVEGLQINPLNEIRKAVNKAMESIQMSKDIRI